MAARRRRGLIPPVVAISGASGAGKTRLLARLVPELARRGVSTAVVKHTRHPHAFDRPGKDTDVLRRAGAVAAAIDGPGGMALFGPPAGSLRALLAALPPVDLVLAEGWKDEPVPRLEVHRRRVAREFLCAGDPHVFAVVTDEPPPRPVRALRPDEVEAIADLVCARAGIGAPPRAAVRLPVGAGVRNLRAEGSGGGAAPRGRKVMARETTGSKRGARRSSRQRAGRKGGRATLRARGPEFFSEIGRKGGKRGGARRRAAARASGRRAGSPRTGRRRRPARA